MNWAEDVTVAIATEKQGKKQLIYPAQQIENGKVIGIVELATDIPFDMPPHLRP